MTWYVLASGPSLTDEDIDRVRWEREQGICRVIVTNSTIQKAPFADYIFSMDGKWLRHNRRITSRSKAEAISSKTGCEQYGARHVKAEGNNTGNKAISYAFDQGADPLIILGFDLQHVDGKTHHHGDHPEPLQNAKNPDGWHEDAREMAGKLIASGRRVINCSPHSKWLGLENMTLEEYLGY